MSKPCTPNIWQPYLVPALDDPTHAQRERERGAAVQTAGPYTCPLLGLT